MLCRSLRSDRVHVHKNLLASLAVYSLLTIINRTVITSNGDLLASNPVRLVLQ